MDVYSHIFLTSALVEGECSASLPGRFTSGERGRGTRWKGGRMDPRVCPDDVEKRKRLIIPGIEHRPLSRLARSQSLYRLCCRGCVPQNINLSNFETYIITWHDKEVIYGELLKV
jgi:hypothetical protein